MKPFIWLGTGSAIMLLSGCLQDVIEAVDNLTFEVPKIEIAASDGAGSGPLTSDEVADLDAAIEIVDDALDDGRFDPPDTRPIGTVSMTGYIGIDEGNPDETMVGNISMVADFEDNTVNGTAGDFVTFDLSGDTPAPTEAFTGTLSIEGTNAGTDLSADLTGTLTGENGAVDFDLDLDGDLYEIDETQTYLGEVSGTINGSTAAGGDFVIQD